MTEPENSHVQVAICGTGFSGLGAAIRMKQEGFRDFALFERANEIGGTWRDNSYPGCACDVESNLYSFSFAPNPDWSRTFSPAGEILDYLKRCARDFGILPHVRFDHEIRGAQWDERAQVWRIETSKGPFTADVVIGGMGALSEPSIPDIPGLSSFEGKVFHSARWDHEYDLRGKRVAVIGTGASAIQIIPAIQPQVDQLFVYQRTPAWVMPRFDRATTERERRRFRRYPILQKLARAQIYAQRELFVFGFRDPKVMKLIELLAQNYLERNVEDPTLRAKLTPNFRLGCKRILISSEYLPALVKPNVSVITSGIREITKTGIIAEDGTAHELDAIIFSTGFHVTDMPFADHVRDANGRSLSEVWQGSPKAYLGTTVPGFPNFFLLAGPNTGLGHSSMVYMIESQIEVVLGALRHMRDYNVSSLEPRKDVLEAYLANIDTRMLGTVWTAGGCASWYIDQTGRNSTLWPGFTFSFRKRARFKPSDYVLRAKQGARRAVPRDLRVGELA